MITSYQLFLTNGRQAPMEEVCEPQMGTMLKNKPHLILFSGSILVSL